MYSLDNILNSHVEIIEINLDTEDCEKLYQIGIQKNTILYVKNFKIKDTIIIELNNISYAIRKDIAKNIIVKKVN